MGGGIKTESPVTPVCTALWQAVGNRPPPANANQTKSGLLPTIRGYVHSILNAATNSKGHQNPTALGIRLEKEI